MMIPNALLLAVILGPSKVRRDVGPIQTLKVASFLLKSFQIQVLVVAVGHYGHKISYWGKM